MKREANAGTGGREDGDVLSKAQVGDFSQAAGTQRKKKKKNSNNANKKDRSEGKVHNSTNSGGGAGRIKRGHVTRGEIHF